MALEKAKEIVASSPVVIFSKTYCPFCTRVKQLLAQLGANYKAVELDVESDGSDLQSALAEWTGQRTVPNVFVKGERIGGCDGESLPSEVLLLLPDCFFLVRAPRFSLNESCSFASEICF
jgi:glutaredoxin 3